MRECLHLIQTFHFHFPSDVASSFPCYKYFLFIPFKMILEVLCFAMLNCNICSHRNAAFFLSEILRKSTCSHEIFHVVGKTFYIKTPENGNTQYVQIILLFDCSNTSIKDLHSALPSHTVSHWCGNNCKHSNDHLPVITVLCQSYGFEMTICIPNQQVFKRHNGNLYGISKCAQLPRHVCKKNVSTAK